MKGEIILALINCPECGKEISDKVTACPGCGYPFEDEQPGFERKKGQKLLNQRSISKKALYIILSVLVIILAVGIVYYQQIIKPEKTYQTANRLLAESKYEEANAILSQITEYKDVASIQNQIKYETQAFACITNLKKVLKNPDSLKINEISFYTSTLPTPHCVMLFSGQNGFGGNTTSYALFSPKDHSLIGTCDTLETTKVDRDDFNELITCAFINSINDESKRIGEVNLSRVNTALKNDAYLAIKIIE